MTSKVLFEALKVQSERHLNVFKKENANFMKLLRKTKRQYVTKYKKGIITKDNILKIYDKCNKYIDDLDNIRIIYLKELIDKLVQTRKVKLTECHVNLNNVNSYMSIDVGKTNIRQLISVNEERDSLTNLNQTLTADDETKKETLNESLVDIEETLNESHMEIEEIYTVNNTDVDLDVTVGNDHVVKDINIVTAQLRVSLEDISHQPIAETDESTDVMEDTITVNNITFDGGIVVGQSYDQMEVIEIVSNNSDSNKLVENNSDYHNAEIMTRVESPLDRSKTMNDTKNSVTSTLSTSRIDTTRTPQASSLFKSKYHVGFGSNQKLAVKPVAKVPASSALKRKPEEVQNQKKLLEEKKVNERLEEQTKRHEKFIKIREQLNKDKTLNHLKSNKDLSKVAPSASKVVPKDKDMTRTEPRAITTSVKVAPIPPKTVTSSVKAPQHAPATAAARPLALKPVNKVSVMKLPVTPVVVLENVLFKTPLTVKLRPLLSESCRKIVVDHNSYDLSGLESDNSDDDENDVGQKMPSWVDKQSGTLGRLSEYHSQNIDHNIFRPAMEMKVSIEEVFDKYEYRIKARSDSDVWR